MKRCNQLALLFAAVLAAQVLSGCALGVEDASTLDPNDLVFVEQSHPEFKGHNPESGEAIDEEGEGDDPHPEPQKVAADTDEEVADEEVADEEAADEERPIFQGWWREELLVEEVRSDIRRGSSSARNGASVIYP
jgi:hypothetical protein